MSREDFAAHAVSGRGGICEETSLSEVFAVGDVRGCNIKRVASTVADGSIAITFVHKMINDRGEDDG